MSKGGGLVPPRLAAGCGGSYAAVCRATLRRASRAVCIRRSVSLLSERSATSRPVAPAVARASSSASTACSSSSCSDSHDRSRHFTIRLSLLRRLSDLLQQLFGRLPARFRYLSGQPGQGQEKLAYRPAKLLVRRLLLDLLRQGGQLLLLHPGPRPLPSTRGRRLNRVLFQGHEDPHRDQSKLLRSGDDVHGG